MRLKNLSKEIGRLTFGTVTTILDLILFNLFIIGEAAIHPEDFHSIFKAEKRIGKLFLEKKDTVLRDAIYRAKKKGLVKEDLKLTEKGKKRLEKFLPQFLPKEDWKGEWYFVIFDIPEKLKILREILRVNLKLLKFGRLQDSVWISPYNFFEKIETIIENYKLDSYVISGISDKIGKEDSQTLAERVWKLDKINQQYAELISEWEKANGKERSWLRFKYLAILREDPQLPKKLLPKDWLGGKARRLFHLL